MKNIYLMVIILLFSFAIAGCIKIGDAPVTKEDYMLGTIIQAKIYGTSREKGNEVIEKIFARVQEIENHLSVNIADSEIVQVNENAGISSIKVGNDAFFVLKKAEEYSNLTKGAFDPTIGPIVKLWGIGTDHAKVPTTNEIGQLLPLVNYEDILLDDNTVFLKRTGQGIDLGAIAKGYVADEMKKILKDEGIKTAFINLGGNVLTIGKKLDGTPWRIGIQNPLDERGEYIGILQVIDQTVVTSGDYERYFEENGVRYHHILDPQTGSPARSGLIGTTIIAKSSIDADALSTSTFIMGLEKGKALIESLPGIEGIFITDDKKIYATSGVKDILKITNEEYQYEER